MGRSTRVIKSGPKVRVGCFYPCLICVFIYLTSLAYFSWYIQAYGQTYLVLYSTYSVGSSTRWWRGGESTPSVFRVLALFYSLHPPLADS
ncbi:uncharacterized protein BO97DRAFT_31037 [Aspergillus homomorphus CBS 101889]|uniref:Uncharacterized protein n=1 Tax=Aspergillus homomorphus (strain CBS 101889) TaxID=1450537 RepID=A0A395I0G1_ASPHC|nr:hypothetical protein BO97DRAFT_31037 [Aspergillus homomorphus CBS 101889]RAL13550.1 hypothetical protein BO97DRAFT_31037 [Aspergillus homomorphus CBS 101889]